MPKYRKKPVVVEVFRFIGDDELIDQLIQFAGSHNLSIHPITEDVYIKTLEGDMHVSYGDYIIRGVHQELYPCKPDIFEKTYELVEE